jgi:hypothetical protein
MNWFISKEKQERMDFIQTYVPTSKAQLLHVAMWYHKGDMQKAQEMVDFYTKNLDLPDFDPVPPTVMDQIKQNASSIFSWIKQNQGDIITSYQFIQQIIANKGVLPAIESAEEESLPPIN